MKHLIHAANGIGAIIDMPRNVRSEGWGEIQAAFVAEYDPSHSSWNSYALMLRLYDDQQHLGVWYDEELAGPDGASFLVIQLPDSGEQNVRRCVGRIKSYGDVVRLQRLVIKKLVDFDARVLEIASKFPERSSSVKCG